MINRFIYILLIIYPFSSVFITSTKMDNTIWGLLMSILIIIEIVMNTNSSKGKVSINIFTQTAIAFSFFMLLSIVLSGDINSTKLGAIYKFIFPLFVASFLYRNLDLNLKSLIFIRQLSLIFIFSIIIFMISRLTIIGFNLFSVMANRVELWFDNVYILAISYSSIVMLYIYLNYKLQKSNKLSVLYLIPMYFTGSRTGMVATTLFLIVYFFIEFRGVTRFFLVSTMFIGSLFLMQSDALLEKVYDTTFELSKSEENAKYEDKEITQSNISSGRTDIYQYYLDEVSFSNFLQGNGIAYFNTIKKFDIRLHNDFLEFFFSFGLIGFCCFIYFIIYKLFISTIISKQGVEKQFLIGLLVFFIGLSLFTSIMDYQNIIYFYFTLIIAMKTNEYLTQKEI